MPEDHQFEISFCESLLRRDPEDLTAMELLAGYYTRSGRIDDGLALDLRIVGLEPANATHHYNLACSLALKRRVREAIAALRNALERGYSDFGWLLKDADLRNLHGDPGFSALLAEFQTKT